MDKYNKYTIYPNLYEFLSQIKNINDEYILPHMCGLLQKIIIIILQNAEQLSLTSGQIKLAFCFISKVKPVLHDTQQCLQIIVSELLVDYSHIQLIKIDKLLGEYFFSRNFGIINPNNPDNPDNPDNLNNNNIDGLRLEHILNIPDNHNNMSYQDRHNHILLESCNIIESSEQILQFPVISQLVKYWFSQDKMFL